MYQSADLNHPILPEAEIRELVRRHRAGDEDAAARIIKHNERMIYRIARRYHSTRVCGDTPLEDLMQWGRIGMMRALEDFDIERGNKFTTYAWSWVRMYISRYGMQQGQKVKLSYQANQKRAKIGHARETFMQTEHREPTPEELQKIVGISAEKIMDLGVPVVSLEMKINSVDTIGEALQDRDADLAQQIEDRLTAETLMRRIRRMPKRTQQIIAMSYGLDGGEPASLQLISEKLGVTRERVRQIREEALKYLRQMA
jgi:RNA polymerase sigma factor (sigma-70 family)